MDKVIIKDLEIMAKHGVNPEEKVNKQRFIVTVKISCQFTFSQESDDIDKTISYSKVKKDVVRIVTENSFNLLEKLSYEIARYILENYELAESVSVTVKKPDAPMSGKFKYVAVKKELKWHRVYLGLGSSMGDKNLYLDNAVKALSARQFKNFRESSRIVSEPYGGAAKNEFINSAAEVYTYLEPYELLDYIHKVEAENDRVRDIHWGDRTLDIDILFFDDLKINDPELCIPHKEIKNRDFVTGPLKELNPNII